MNTLRLVLRELFERKTQLLTSFLAIMLGITVIVSIQTMTHFSRIAVAQELDNLGANILIMPKESNIDNYYRSDFVDAYLPESYVRDITTSDLKGLDSLSPRLVVPGVPVGDKKVNLTGVLPKDEFPKKPDWTQAGDVFTVPKSACGPDYTPNTTVAQNAVRRKIIEHLGHDECFVGSNVAEELKLTVGSKVSVKGRAFKVVEVLPQTGTVDDTRILAHLHVVQEMYNTGPVINVVEVVGCCKEIRKGLVSGLNKLLPAARVVTIKQIVSAQQKTNDLMDNFALIFLIIIVIVGGVSIANYMSSNVYERRKEIGTLLAIGATPGRVLWIFILKALILGVSGGALGYVTGTLLAFILGPQIAKMPVKPLPELIAWALAIAVAISILASVLPARRAAKTDPAVTVQET